jgi:hypothetical protein
MLGLGARSHAFHRSGLPVAAARSPSAPARALDHNLGGPRSQRRYTLAWAGEPLATVEVAAVMQLALVRARVALGRAARPLPAGADFYWAPGREPRGE